MTRQLLANTFDAKTIAAVDYLAAEDADAVLAVWFRMLALAVHDPEGSVRLTPGLQMDTEALAGYFHCTTEAVCRYLPAPDRPAAAKQRNPLTQICFPGKKKQRKRNEKKQKKRVKRKIKRGISLPQYQNHPPARERRQRQTESNTTNRRTAAPPSIPAKPETG